MIACLTTGAGAISVPAMTHAQTTLAVETRSNSVAVDAVLAKPVTVTLDRVSLAHAIDDIAAAAAVTVIYRTDAVSAVSKPVTLHAVRLPLGDAFAKVLDGTSLHLVLLPGGHLSVTSRGDTPAQNETVFGGIAGKVIDGKTNRPMVGVSLTLDGATKGVLTGNDGAYVFPHVTASEHVVTIKYLGYTRQSRHVTVTDESTVTLDVTLMPSANQLDQIVVTGTVIPTEIKSVPNAITVITAKELEQRGVTRVDQLFRGDIPGLFSVNQGTSVYVYGPNQVTSMYSRGATSLPQYGTDFGPNPNPIKTYVDGVELANMQYLNQIDPKSIERIEIITGPQASTIYGSNALGGVMQIFTKRGATAKPQITASALLGTVENSFTPARTPQHDYSAQMNGVEGRLSYNGGGSWIYVGRWTPSEQVTTASGFGGVHLQTGPMTADASFRMAVSSDHSAGGPQETVGVRQANGYYVSDGLNNNGGVSAASVTTETVGLSVGYAPTTWWSHQFTVGHDASDSEKESDPYHFYGTGDTTFAFRSAHYGKTSVSYSTTARTPVTSIAQLVMTAGADEWNDITIYTDALSLPHLSGMLNGTYPPSIFRQPNRNSGAFVQGQLKFFDALTFTYGLRAEWNPNYGKAVQPNYAPRYGVAYAFETGGISAKFRASYGRSTRPPTFDQKVEKSAWDDPYSASYYKAYYPNNFDLQIANPDLGPEFQQGGEGGVDLYFGKLGSLIVTRYNQTADGLIAGAAVDSVRSIPYPYGPANNQYYYLQQLKNVNIGSIRNQGWEFQGTVNTGPLTTKGTYSWTKSRMIGITPAYRALFPVSSYPQYGPGAVFNNFPEHTWALLLQYGKANSVVSLDVHGIGMLYRYSDDLSWGIWSIRLDGDKARMSLQGYRALSRGYTTTDVNATHRFAKHVELVAQIQNLGNYYRSDYSTLYPVMGRQSKFGVRLRY